MMWNHAEWIGTKEDTGAVCPEFFKHFSLSGEVKSAQLAVTAIGVYEAEINGKKVGNAVLAPGCTSYLKRLQYQTYDVKELLSRENTISIFVGTGWHRGRISEASPEINKMPCAVLVELSVEYMDGTKQQIVSDESFSARTSRILSADLYDGEYYDASLEESTPLSVTRLELTKDRLVAQDGEFITEHERITPCKLIVTPKGERVIDFGQNFAGYPEISLTAKKGDVVKVSCAEILDKDGNFYRENYRSAKAEVTYICRDGAQTYKPRFTFMGFRYLKVEEFPGEVDLNAFTGIAVYSDMKRRGSMASGNPLLNRFYENVLWSQRANFIDVPTDCPQRDERMGWTGDAQVFAKTAGYNYDTYRFFRKWLADVRAEQRDNGSVPDMVPNFWRWGTASTAWGDVICIVPWQMYLLFGNKAILEDNFEAMKKWVDYMTADTTEEFLWTCTEENKAVWRKHYGDWLALDAPYGSYKGKTDDDRIASAFYYYSCSLVVKAGHAIGKDVAEYETLAKKIAETYRERFTTYETQTDCVLALYFGLTKDKTACVAKLAELVKESNGCLQTGFVGTPYLLYALGENGYTKLAYDLLFNEKNPSWFYEVLHGATTVWEHWDGVNDEGKIWSSDMNSYNHYAYGAVIDWVYSFAAGIQADEEHPGFEKVLVAPHADKRLGFLDVKVETAHGTVASKWVCTGDEVRYEISVPVSAAIVIGGMAHEVGAGTHVFYS